MKLIPKFFFLIITLILFSATTYAQGGASPPPPSPPVPPGGPIDSNIYILLFMALALGFYKLYQSKKHKKTPN